MNVVVFQQLFSTSFLFLLFVSLSLSLSPFCNRKKIRKIALDSLGLGGFGKCRKSRARFESAEGFVVWERLKEQSDTLKRFVIWKSWLKEELSRVTFLHLIWHGGIAQKISKQDIETVTGEVAYFTTVWWHRLMSKTSSRVSIPFCSQQEMMVV